MSRPSSPDVVTSHAVTPDPANVDPAGPANVDPAGVDPHGGQPGPAVAAVGPTVAAERPRPARLDALDRFRGAALVLMLVHHLVEWLTGDAREVLPGWPDFTLTDLAAPAFFVAAGASCCLLVASRRRRHMSWLRVAGMVLRRYGLLVPIGMALQWALWHDPFAFGVLEAIGVTVVAGALVAAVLPQDLLALAAVGALAFGVMVERDVTGQTDWAAVELLGGNFPVITYLGFVLAGMAAVRSGRFVDRRWILGAAVVGVVAVALMLLDGIVPARYPGDIGLIIPGLAGTAVLYALSQGRWQGWLRGVDKVLRRGSTHTFGIFVGHYGIYWLLRETGVVRSVEPVVAVPTALAVAVLLCAVAPHVPQPPWSLRTGWRRSARPIAVRPSSGP